MTFKAISANISGGSMLARRLRELGEKLGKGTSVKVGFLAGAVYSGVHPIRGTKRFEGPVATVAFWNEFGTKTAPPRPFFRNMIAQESPTWARKMSAAAKATKYNAHATMELMGLDMSEALTQSIATFSDPANAARTVAIKGFNKPLVDDGTLQRSVGYEVTVGL